MAKPTHDELTKKYDQEILDHLEKYRDKYPRHVRTPEQFIEYQALLSKFESDNAFADGWEGD